jgi:hypothetical protein
MLSATTRKSPPQSVANTSTEIRPFLPPRNVLDPKILLSMPPSDLQKMQSLFGFGDELGFIRFPKYLWNTRWHESDSYVDMAHVLAKYGTSIEERNLAVCTLVRWFLICLCVPTTTSNARRPVLLAPTTVFSRLTGLMIPLSKAALQKPPHADGMLFARLQKSDFVDADDSKSRRFGLEFRRLDYLARRALWLDEPIHNHVVSHAEPSNKTPAKKLKSPPKIQEWKPLPDDLTHAAGWRSAWITEHLAPVLLDAFEQTIALRRGFGVQNSYIPGNRFVSSYAWEIPGIEKGEGPPFQTHDMSWPPSNTAELLVWLKLVQQANSFISGLSAGPRASEILSWRTDCLVEARDGITVAKGRTYKIVAPVDGAATDWPLPKVAVQAIYQQVRLSLLLTRLAIKIEEEKQKLPKARVSVCWEPIAQRMRELNLTRHGLNTLCGIRYIDKWANGVTPLVENVMKVAGKLEIPLAALLKDPAALAYATARPASNAREAPLESQPLWRVFGGKGKGNALTGTYNDDFRDYIKTLGLLHLTDDQKLVHHRFRKTIARVVALCYAHAPQILMDIFGHHDIDMTLHYILADPTILADINAIQRELKVMKACELIQNVDSCGGAAAKRLKHAVTQFKMGKEDFDTEDVYEAAVLWTLDGRTWDLIGQGRYCLKGPLDKAPCAKMHSIANKAKCNKNCEHRLVSPEGIRDSDEAISDAIKNLEQAWAADDYIMATQWSGQILAKIDDHEQLFEKWKDHLTVVSVLVDAGRKSTSV